MKKKLLVVIEAIQMNGAIKGWLGYLDAIDKNEWDVDVFLFDATKYDGIDLPNYVRRLPEDIHCVIERVGLMAAIKYTVRRGRFDLAFKRIIYSILYRWFTGFQKWNLISPAKRQVEHYDVAIGSSQGVSWQYVAEKVDSRVKLLWVDTDVRAGYWKRTWNHFKRFVPACSGIVCVSESMRDAMRMDNPQWENKIFSVNYVIDDKRILKMGNEPSPFPSSSRLRLVTVGRYSREKGQHLIPAIAGRLAKNGLDFEWYVVAPGSSAHMEQITSDLVAETVSNRVVFTDGMANPYPVVRSSDISVQPSSFEGFGLTVSEAMILGVYVVASDLPSFREQIRNESEGILAKSIDVDGFVDAILRAVQIIREGKVCQCYKTPYSAKKTYQQILQVIEQVTQ